MYEKQSVTPERALEYAVTHAFQSDADWEAAVKSFDTYVRTGDVVTLRKTVTPGRIHKALGWSSKVSEKRALEDYHWRKRNYQQDGGFKNDEEYLKYRQSLAEAVCALTSETPEEETAEKFFATFKRLVDEKKETYLQDVEQDAAEMRLLQPLIVSVSKSRRYQEKALEAGADMVFRELSQEDMEKLVALGNRIRTSPASVATERLRRNKSDFYQDVVDQLEDRSEQTADTEKELFLLASLFEKTGTKKVLDVGCGYGRLALPLAKQGYDVTGLDVSRTLLEKAKADKGTRRNLHYKSGDIIDYRGTVDKENFDAVYYGWHSFLEAYGPGNALTSLHSAREALKPGGILAFDQPSRENPGLEDGWYGDEAHGYMAYLMEDDELKFLLAAAGFEDIRILRWRAKESSLYPDGMKKVTVVARKPTF